LLIKTFNRETDRNDQRRPPERVTQNRVIALFRDELGYRYLGDWTDRRDKSNIQADLLGERLTKIGYSGAQIT
jgi:type I restriction enzyme R subunit